MIKISRYKSSFEKEYFEFVFTKIKGRIEKIKKVSSKKSKEINEILKKIKKESLDTFLEYIVNNAEQIIIGDFSTLSNDILLLVKDFNINKKEINEFISYMFSYSDFISTNQDFSYTIAQNMNSKVCPFCNKNSTEFISKNKKHRYDFDHFYPKSAYPYFAVSLYNLIPICSDCNKIKSNDVFTIENNMYPYDEGTEEENIFGFEVLENNDYRIVNKSKNSKYNNNERMLQIVERYNYNLESTNLVNTLEKCKRHSTPEYVAFVKKYFGFTKKEILNELGYTPKQELKNKAFSKFTNDIIDLNFNYNNNN